MITHTPSQVSACQEFLFPKAADPFRDFFSLPFEEIVTTAKESTHDGYELFQPDIPPPTQKEKARMQKLTKEFVSSAADPFSTTPSDFPIRIISSNSAIENPLLDIREDEAHFFRNFYIAIVNDLLSIFIEENGKREKHSQFSFIGEESFIEKCKEAIHILFRRPLGRSLFLTLYRIQYPCIIEQGAYAHVGSNSRSYLHIFLTSSKTYYAAEERGRIRLLKEWPFYISMAHEFLHGIQKVSLLTRAQTIDAIRDVLPKMFQAPGEEKHFSNLIERITILGVNGNIPSENAFHFQFETSKAFSHQNTGFPPALSRRSCTRILNRDGRSRVQSAAYFGLGGEVSLLLNRNASPEEALFGAIEGGEEQVARVVLSYNPNLTKRLEHTGKSVIEYVQSETINPSLLEILFRAPLYRPPKRAQKNNTRIIAPAPRPERDEIVEFFNNFVKFFKGEL